MIGSRHNSGEFSREKETDNDVCQKVNYDYCYTDSADPSPLLRSFLFSIHASLYACALNI